MKDDLEMTQWKGIITADPEIMLGKPTIVGTRITVEHILEKLSHGEVVEQILDSHPQLTEESVKAAVAYALDVLRMDVVYPVDEVAD